MSQMMDHTLDIHPVLKQKFSKHFKSQKQNFDYAKFQVLTDSFYEFIGSTHVC